MCHHFLKLLFLQVYFFSQNLDIGDSPSVFCIMHLKIIAFLYFLNMLTVVILAQLYPST